MKNIPEFATKEELFKHLKENKSFYIDQKKSQVKHTDPLSNASSKSVTLIGKTQKEDNDSEITREVVANTYYWLDSHSDVHVKSCFTKSIQENVAHHLNSHKFGLDHLVGETQKVEEREIAWKDLGVDIPGSTISLIASSSIKKSFNEKIFYLYKTGTIKQHSVGMRYVKIEMAINSSEEEYKREKEVWDKYIDRIGNKDKCFEQGYFWVVKEAKLIEYSCVLRGSNELTPTLENESKSSANTALEAFKENINYHHNEEQIKAVIDQLETLLKEPLPEPSKDTQESQIDYEYLKDNFTI